jgi:hypothetical protein
MFAYTSESQHTLLFLRPVSVHYHIMRVPVCGDVPGTHAEERPYLEKRMTALLCESPCDPTQGKANIPYCISLLCLCITA